MINADLRIRTSFKVAHKFFLKVVLDLVLDGFRDVVLDIVVKTQGNSTQLKATLKQLALELIN